MGEYRPFKGWEAFSEKTGRESYTDYVKPGDYVDQETFNYFMDVLPPASCRYEYRYLQMGEPHSFCELDGEYVQTFLTFAGRNGKIYFCGALPRGYYLDESGQMVRFA